MSNGLPPEKILPIDAAGTVIELLRQDTPVCFKAGGPSMNPTVRDGEPVKVRPLHPADLRSGAILLYLKNGRLVLHRLIGKDSKTGNCFFAGDAALRGQDRVNISEIAGIATGVQRKGRLIQLDTRAERSRGRLRYWARPLRRLVWSRVHSHHTDTPTC